MQQREHDGTRENKIKEQIDMLQKSISIDHRRDMI